MVRTRVGYAGGQKEKPTYRSLGNHSEAIQVDFDPDRISYERLLEVFWDAHAPHARTWHSQYANILFYTNAKQKKAALASKERIEEATGRKVQTRVKVLERFWRAEDYHQKHNLQNDALLGTEVKRMFPNARAMTDSTAATRMNAFLGGFGSPEVLSAEIDEYGLSEKGRQRLVKIFEP